VGEIKRFLPIPEGSPIHSGLVELKNGTVSFVSLLWNVFRRLTRCIDPVWTRNCDTCYWLPILVPILATILRWCKVCASCRLCHNCIILPSLGRLAHPRLVSRPVLSPRSHTCIPWRSVVVLCVVLHPCSFRDAVPLAAHTISSLEYTTLALAKVWTHKAKLPNSQTMLALHEKTVEDRGGYGKYVLFFGPERASGKSFAPCVVLGLSIYSCHSSCYLLDGLAQ
jgi:hypothetical protein